MLYFYFFCDICIDIFHSLTLEVGFYPASFFRKVGNMQRHNLQDLLEPVIESLGYETIRILTIGKEDPTLQVMIDVAGGGREITVDDCAKVSRKLSVLLDEKDPIAGKYTLEVSSPGLDRPLTKPAHFERFAGNTAKVELYKEVDGRKRIKGIILPLDAEGNIRLDMDGKEYVTAFENIAKAKIVITDELWEKYQAEHEAIEL